MKLLSILIIALASSYSFAGHHNEAVWQAHGGKNVVHAGYTYSSLSLQAKDLPSAELTANTNRISLDYERGFNDMFSAGLGLDYTTLNTESGLDDNNSTGIEHINLFFNGNHTLGFGGLYYGLDVRVGTEDQDVDNTSTGRVDINPNIALVMGDRMMGYGIKLDYIYRTKESHEDESEFEGGNTLNVNLFFEKSLSDKSIFGVGLNYAMTEFQEDEAGKDYGSETNLFTLDLYGAVTCGCSSRGMAFLPKVSYTMGTGEDSSGDDLTTSGGSYAIEMALRKEF